MGKPSVSRYSKPELHEMLKKHFGVDKAPAWETDSVAERIRKMPLSERLQRAYTFAEKQNRPDSQRAIARQIIRQMITVGETRYLLDAYNLAKKT